MFEYNESIVERIDVKTFAAEQNIRIGEAARLYLKMGEKCEKRKYLPR